MELVWGSLSPANLTKPLSASLACDEVAPERSGGTYTPSASYTTGPPPLIGGRRIIGTSLVPPLGLSRRWSNSLTTVGLTAWLDIKMEDELHHRAKRPFVRPAQGALV
ncbi:hypothetical protein PCASD_23790 [Puccinia coronata f. sp. avenae]|uniref:Uncharacterized protein n=1 Tax=Puccinia coronata f. sp. avenae TaxID=200324 RepID=A0A2N5SZ49_9BASI|nr:hypothetical protein PCASD_23790 [Puccinia coronata f. sp. avenae]